MSDKLKDKLYQRIDDNFSELQEMSKWLYDNPELPMQEYKSVERLIEYLEKYGFEVETKIANLDTSFIARYKIGEGGPKIGFLAEYDALPEVGHGCGHNLIAASCVGSAVNLAKTLEPDTPAEIIVFGTPDEEYDGGKIFMAEEGAFQGIDAALQIHPSPVRNDVGGSSTPHQTMVIDFHGKSAHTAFNPTEGINALNAVHITFAGLHAMHQYLKRGTRIPATITNGGGAPNTVPDFAQMRVHVTTIESDYLEEVVQKIENCAQAGALATGARAEINKGPAYKKLFSNGVLTKQMEKNLKEMGYDLAEPPEAPYATDVGNVSWECPTTMGHLSLQIPDVAMHTKKMASTTVSEQGEKTLRDSVKAMASTALDMITDNELLEQAKQEFNETMNK
ncbi:amidohydrolase [Natranaerobius thermophilus]|uniref:Peptidase M20 domain-containing protein 2 n=1 Tax=Natranaerobius thermophilus (strain ATCC BAA-1301 / DSM 18059 / JW/NM-WN-LF) TaxID=457570 RepID=B2A2B8_NATTJ|nr:amidohydrolase [Natranaerobius thermophilus]ACB86224.1 amidohydrolase [Natranaerobius thermophilus JW/NM-WN-LF]